MSDLHDFERRMISDHVEALKSIGNARIETWLRERSDSLGFAELVMSANDPDRIGSNLMLGLAVVGDSARPGHADVEGVVEMWEWMVAVEAHPLIAAQAARNMWASRSGTRPVDSAHLAISLFTSVAKGSAGRACERAEAGVDALEIAAEIGSKDGVVRQLQCIVGLLDLALAEAEALPAERSGPPNPAVMTEQQLAEQVAPVKDETEPHGACLYILRALSGLLDGRY